MSFALVSILIRTDMRTHTHTHSNTAARLRPLSRSFIQAYTQSKHTRTHSLTQSFASIPLLLTMRIGHGWLYKPSSERHSITWFATFKERTSTCDCIRSKQLVTWEQNEQLVPFTNEDLVTFKNEYQLRLVRERLLPFPFPVTTVTSSIQC